MALRIDSYQYVQYCYTHLQCITPYWPTDLLCRMSGTDHSSVPAVLCVVLSATDPSGTDAAYAATSSELLFMTFHPTIKPVTYERYYCSEYLATSVLCDVRC
eukprot:733209-Rhodomonas_salina.5